MTIYQETATISFAPIQSAGAVNPVTGRPTFTQAPTETLSISIEQRDTKGYVVASKGRDVTGTYVAGRLLPIGTKLPDWYKVGLECDITLSDGSQGKFYVLTRIPSRFGLENVFGERITGVIYNNGQ